MTVSTCARISLAVAGHDVTPITMMMFVTDRPITAASTIASGRKGMTRNHSVNRMSTEPGSPPKKPATMPTTEPITIAITVAASPTSRLMREPQTNCAQTLRLRLSVPSGGNSDGVAQRGLSTALIGVSSERSASSGAARAIPTTRTSTTRPIIPAVELRYSAQFCASERRRRCQAMRRAESVASTELIRRPLLPRRPPPSPATPCPER